MDIKFFENGLYVHVHVSENGEVFLVNLSSKDQPAPEKPDWYRLVELQVSGFNQKDHHGSKHTGTQPGSLLRYLDHTSQRNSFGEKLEIRQVWQGLVVTSHLQFFDGMPVVKSWSDVKNNADRHFPIEYISSFSLVGLNRQNLGQRDQNGIVHIPHSTWYGEAQWKSYSLNEAGYDVVNDFSMKRICLSSTGSWSCSEYLPMGSFENTETGETMTWQIETSGSWNWELSDIGKQLYLQISGPSYQENDFVKIIKTGETFTSVPCAIAFVQGSFEESIRQLTHYRRAIRRVNEDNIHPAVIFNDYMNCLMGDPTTKKEYPLIDAAAEAGCKYYCVDCGWYDDGPWWDGVGEWLPSKARFPGGIEEPLNYIREKGMIPGLWLELEVMGVECPLVNKVPKNWFFQRNGVPIIEHSRYQLDFRNPEVAAFADSVVDRLVKEYGVGYIKMDYNINAGPGTQLNADSAGEGLLAHTRAYLAWLDRVFARYPDLIIENCSSGGMRMDYSMLSRQSIQSVTDQTDYLKMAAIACNCMTAVTPEQAAIWSYPLREGDIEETIFNMVNAIPFRIHQSGHLAEMSTERLKYIQEGIEYHKQICEQLNQGLPFWPIGLATLTSPAMGVGIDCGAKKYLAVWNVSQTSEVIIPLNELSSQSEVICAYPQNRIVPFQWDKETNTLRIALKPRTARIFEIS